MDTATYLRFVREIASWARNDDDPSLVVTGSGARVSHEPDRWSDHDFWVIAHPRAAARRDTQPVADAAEVLLGRFLASITIGVALYGRGELLRSGRYPTILSALHLRWFRLSNL